MSVVLRGPGFRGCALRTRDTAFFADKGFARLSSCTPYNDSSRIDGADTIRQLMPTAFRLIPYSYHVKNRRSAKPPPHTCRSSGRIFRVDLGTSVAAPRHICTCRRWIPRAPLIVVTATTWHRHTPVHLVYAGFPSAESLSGMKRGLVPSRGPFPCTECIGCRVLAGPSRRMDAGGR